MPSWRSIREVDDLAPFAWIEEGLRTPVGSPPEGDTLRTVDLLPSCFEAYAKVFHPIYEDPERSGRNESWNEVEGDAWRDESVPAMRSILRESTLVRTNVGNEAPHGWRRVFWAELAKDLGLRFHPQFSEGDLDGAWPGRSWPARLIGPEEGGLTNDQIATIARAADEGAQPGAFYFWWWVVAGLNALSGDDLLDHLFLGKLRDLPGFLDAHRVKSPTYWWPETKAWCVSTDWDLCFSIIGGSEPVISRVLEQPEIEGFRINAEDALFATEGSA